MRRTRGSCTSVLPPKVARCGSISGMRRGARFVQSDAHTFTAGGLTSGFDLALHVVSIYFGDPVAQQTADWLEYRSTEWKTARP